MTKKAVLKIIGNQHYEQGNDDKVELTTLGTIEETEDKYIIRYNEEQEPPEGAIRARLSILKNCHCVEMLRTGAVGSCLIIERSRRNLCRYGTEFGDLLMGIYGRSIESSIGEDEGSFTFAYDIDVNGAVTSQNEVTIKYRISQEIQDVTVS